MMDTQATAVLNDSQKASLQNATQCLAPNWPLDRMIAVNPLWKMVDRPFDQVATEMSLLAGIRCHMPVETYLDWYEQGRIDNDCLLKAASEYGLSLSVESLTMYLSKEAGRVQSWRNIADWADLTRSNNKMSWHDEITHQISQFCAAHYQEQRPMLNRQYRQQSLNLYEHWLQIARLDRGLSIIMSEAHLDEQFDLLPDDQESLFAEAIKTLKVTHTSLEQYGKALLLDINGWGSYLAYRAFEAEKQGKSQDDVRSLLAIKMAWELVVWRYLEKHNTADFEALNERWGQQLLHINELRGQHHDALLIPRIWARALELSEQKSLQRQLTQVAPNSPEAPALQAIFCIDVRSEVYRRALESQSASIETYGFAGFFGLPIEYEQAGTQVVRPQLPGLVPATIRVFETQANDEQLAQENRSASWNRWGNAASATFSMVESMGWWYAFKLFKKSLKGDTSHALAPANNSHWTLTRQGHTLSVDDQAQLAKGVLDTMGLRHFSSTVMLVGHGSHSCNNLQSAGLECGACGGQSGEVNVKVLAQLLNNLKVREALKPLGYSIPDHTQFVPALHNTITDHITCYSDVNDLRVRDWLTHATYLAQQERAPRVDENLMHMTKEVRDAAYLRRAQDWSQTRPEWGLADNNAFIIAPRQFTRELDLQGRSFLHDYAFERDTDAAVLERLMTAPMLVTHWINMQYNLSTTDNFKFGSGNKVLHNAVGDHIGVFEGNGGDLRVGLALQSLHNGEKWMHTPERLAVYIRAPKSFIEKIVKKHELLKNLINNQWLYVFQWDGQAVSRYNHGDWSEQA
ncbi:YbcC family protein [Marinomonas fungiae]|uniref:YbcC family protein n=1 Tax=Marinomonas fungiae TaxID=1137284 RepID=UPI003A920EBB